MSRSLKFILSSALAVALITGGFIGGYLLAAGSRAPRTVGGGMIGLHGSRETTTAADVAERLKEVQSILEAQALQPSQIESATAGAIQGLLGAQGDRYAEYRSPQLTSEIDMEMTGEFGGIGVVLGEADGVVSVHEVYEGTPAERADVRVGDVFVSVDGETRDSWTTDDIADRVRGEKGTQVEIVFRRPTTIGASGGEMLTKSIERDTIVTKNVKNEVVDGIGYIYMGSFNGRSTQDIAAAIEELDAEGVGGYVLDLRYNGGGLLDEAVGVASLFIDSGTVVQVESRNGDIDRLDAKGIKITDKPLVLLVNEHSASASEVLAGALKDYGRAKIVGMKTFGKGSVQTVVDLSFGGSIKFTSAHYLSPEGTVIDGVGVTPDVEVKGGEVPHFALESHDEDAQLMKAIQTVKSIGR